MATQRIIRLFEETDLHDYLAQGKGRVQQSIAEENEDYLLSINEQDYFDYQVSKAYITPLEIHEDKIYKTPRNEIVPVYKFTSYKNPVERTQLIIQVHIPVSGDSYLLTCRPNPKWPSGNPIEVHLATNEFYFEIRNTKDDPNLIEQEIKKILEDIMNKFSFLENQVNQHNENLKKEISETIKSRKNQILKNKNILASISIPFKQITNVPETFSIPLPEARKKIVIKKPETKETLFVPEPTLSNDQYTQLLSHIHDMGRHFEKYPKTYNSLKEENLRNLILLILESHFVGSVTGETFNKTGKTDILLQHENKNVFVAECKIWSGKESLLETINQLLGYLTWRESKVSAIFFVRRQNFSRVLKTVEEGTCLHPNYIEFNGKTDETRLDYTFHFTGDRNKLVKLAILLYHIPL
ncbi:MAG: hypothetical protein OT477_17835 [Chloroflexi bacterium]|nr:hypothetical protein [Chloroflexota bacterium]